MKRTIVAFGLVLVGCGAGPDERLIDERIKQLEVAAQTTAPPTTVAQTTVALAPPLDLDTAAIEYAFNLYRDSICGDPAADSLSDAEIIAIVEDGYGEQLSQAARVRLIELVRACT